MSILPTFSTSGWVENPIEQADFLLSYFFLTQKSQTMFHTRVVTSYQYLISEAISIGDLKSKLTLNMTEFLKSQFTNVQLDIDIVGAFDNPDNSELTIKISCNYEANNRRYGLSRAIDVLGTNVKRIYVLNETGVLT